MLCVTINIIYLALWTAIDRYQLIDVDTYHLDTLPPHFETVRQCKSVKYGHMWLALLYVYSGFLFLALVLGAFKTRKIRNNNYKDSKKITGFVAVLVLTLCIGGPLWGILQSVHKYILSRLYTIGGLERWTGLVDWTTGLTDFQSETRRGAPETL